jgi:CRISPR/Cas system CSM-associated protein Csm4 (group 5 of RAMP superfamily)
MSIKDLCPITTEEAVVNNEGDDDNKEAEPMKRKIKHKLAEAALLSIATTMCDLENIIDDYPQYATIGSADSDSERSSENGGTSEHSSDDGDGNTISRTNGLSALRNYHTDLKETYARAQVSFKEFADLLRLKNADSC